MRILILNKHVEDGVAGSEVQCHIIASRLAGLGHQVVYGAIHSRRTSYESPYTVLRLGKPGLREFRRALREASPDVVYWRYDTRSLLAVATLCRRYGIKLVVGVAHVDNTRPWVVNHRTRTADSPSIKTRALLSTVRKAIRGRLNFEGYRWVDGIVFQLQCQAESPLGRLGIRNVVIPNSWIRQATQPFSWPRPYVVWVASIKRSKNPELFIDAARRLSHLPVDFLMVGAIRDTAYQYMTDRRRLSRNVHFLGKKPVTDVDAILAGSLFNVHTCDPEGLPNIFIQAWFQGKPTITLRYDPDGLIETHRIGYHGKTMAGFIDRIEYLVGNPQERHQMGVRAARMANDLFQPERNVERLEEFLISIAGDIVPYTSAEAHEEIVGPDVSHAGRT